MAETTIESIDRSLRDLFEKGSAALQKQNLDYAIALFNQVLQAEPGCLECRMALRQAQLKKAGGGSGFFKKVFGSTSAVSRGQLALRKDPLEAIQVAEQILGSDPNNIQAHKLLAEAASAADLPKTAIISMEQVYKHSPQDKDVVMRFAEMLAAAGGVARGEMLLKELLRSDPSDADVSQALKNLSASRTLAEGGYEALSSGQGSYRDILRNKQEAISLEQERREVKDEDVATRLIAEYEARIPREPGNLKLVKSIAELHTQNKNYDKALEYYDRLLSTDGGADPSLEKTVSEVRLKLLEKRMEELDPNDPGFAERHAGLQKEKELFILQECKSRAERYPNDLLIRHELGQLYFQLGKISEAIGEFQKAQSNPHKKISSLNYLGQCFAKRNMNDMAARTFQNALKEKVVFDEEKKELLYHLGCVLEKMQKREEAIEQLKQIYEVDIGYKDVASKVDAYYASLG